MADHRDLCPGSKVDSEVGADGCEIVETAEEAKAESIELKVLFDTDSAEVRSKYYSEIQQVADFLQRHPGANATIEGHTDSRGNGEYNLKLSQRRADAVRQVLIEHMGASPERVAAIGFGGRRLLRQGDSKEAHDANRRVVAVIERGGK